MYLALDLNNKRSSYYRQGKRQISMLCGHHGIALQASANRGREEITKLFLENGIDVNIESGNYHTALQAASSRGRGESTRLCWGLGPMSMLKEENVALPCNQLRQAVMKELRDCC